MQMRPYICSQENVKYGYGYSLTLSIIHSRSPGKSSFFVLRNELSLLIPCNNNYLKTLLRPVCGL